MAKLSAVIRPGRANKEGRCNVEFAISHFSQTCYIKSGLEVKRLSSPKNSFPFVSGMVTKKDPEYVAKNIHIAELLFYYNARLSSLMTENMTAREIADALTGSVRNVGTVSAAMEEYSQLKRKEGSKGEKNALMCERACRRFLEWVKTDLRVEDLNSVLLNSYKEYLKNLTVDKVEKVPYWHECGQKRYMKKVVKVAALSPATISSDLSRLKAVLKNQKNCSIDWRDIRISAPSRCECDIEVEDLRRYRSLQFKDKVEKIARDVWLLSFYLGGMNFTDMMNVDFRGSTIFYTREKTKGRTDTEVTVGIPIHARARAIIKKYMMKDGHLDFGYNYANKDDELKMYAQEYRDARFEYGMPECFMFKSARHTFSQFASDLNLPERVTNYILAHTEGKSNIMYYYRKVKQKQVESVMNIIFDYVEHPNKYEDVLEFTRIVRDVI